MAAHTETFAKMKVHRDGHLIVKGNEAAKSQYALSKSMLVVPNHLDYHGAAGGFQGRYPPQSFQGLRLH